VGFATGISLWLLYGIITRQMPVILANGVTLALQGSIIFMKLRYAKAGKSGLGEGTLR
jgi:MtN3 and saliva related transmembrane protein